MDDSLSQPLPARARFHSLEALTRRVCGGLPPPPRPSNAEMARRIDFLQDLMTETLDVIKTSLRNSTTAMERLEHIQATLTAHGREIRSLRRGFDLDEDAEPDQ